MKFRLIVTLLVTLLTSLAMAQTPDASAQKRFQGNWLGYGCLAKNEPVAFSFSINGDVITLHQMAKADTQEVSDMKAPKPEVHGTYKFYKDGQPTLTFDGYSFSMFIYDGGTGPLDGFEALFFDGSLHISMSHGPASDLTSFAGAYGSSCANFQ